MLGEILDEFVSTAIRELLSPSTDRGRVRLNLVVGAIAVGVEVWAFALADNPLRGSQSAFGLMMLGMVLGIGVFVFSLACLVRLERHRLASGISALLAAVALFWPLSLLVP